MAKKHLFSRPGKDAGAQNRLLIILESAVEYFVSLLVTGAFLARLTQTLGFSDGLTGILSAFVSLACLFQLAGSALFKNCSSIKGLSLACQTVSRLLFALVYLIPASPLPEGLRAGLFLVCFCGGYIALHLAYPQKNEWLISLVPDGQRGIFSAHREIVSLIGSMFFTYAMGSLIDGLEESGQPRLALIAGAVTVIALMLPNLLLLLLIPEKKPSSGQPGPGQGFRAMLQNEKLRRAILLTGLWQVAHSLSTPFFGAYQIKELGFSMTFVSILNIGHSLLRAGVSPFMGRYADRFSFSRMMCLCLGAAAAAYAVNIFTVPANGKICFAVYYALYAVAMAGLNSALMNLIFDYVPEGRNRQRALALSSAAGGVAAFATTCLVSPLVTAIQARGNTFFGLPLYPPQLLSALSALMMGALLIYGAKVVIPGEKKP